MCTPRQILQVLEKMPQLRSLYCVTSTQATTSSQLTCWTIFLPWRALSMLFWLSILKHVCSVEIMRNHAKIMNFSFWPTFEIVLVFKTHVISTLVPSILPSHDHADQTSLDKKIITRKHHTMDKREHHTHRHESNQLLSKNKHNEQN